MLCPSRVCGATMVKQEFVSQFTGQKYKVEAVKISWTSHRKSHTAVFSKTINNIILLINYQVQLLPLFISIVFENKLSMFSCLLVVKFRMKYELVQNKKIEIYS